MLSSPDRELALREVAMPGFALLLDADAFAGMLAERLSGVDVASVQPTYVRYKPHTNCLVRYRAVLNGAESCFYAKSYPMSAREKFAKARESFDGCPDARRRGVILEDEGIVVYLFPQDAKLRSLARLHDAHRGETLRRLLPRHPDLWDAQLRPLHYKPERRYVASLIIEGQPRAVLKLYTPSDYYAASMNDRLFDARGPLRVARRLGQSRRRGALVLEWLPGDPLDEHIQAAGFDPARVEAVGETLAALHAQYPAEPGDPGRDAQVMAARAAAAAVAAICPPLAGRAEQLASQLVERLVETGWPVTAIHGDFSADQVLLGSQGVALLDLDNAGWGNPLSDLGSFIAQLERDTLRGTLPPGRAERVTEALLAGYRSSGKVERGDLDLHVSAGLLRLAAEPFRLREPEWPRRVEAILTCSENHYRRACGPRRLPQAPRVSCEGWSI